MGTTPKTKCDLSATRAYDLIAIADGRKTVADVRLGNTKRKQKERACRDVTADEPATIRPSRHGQNKADEPQSHILR